MYQVKAHNFNFIEYIVLPCSHVMYFYCLFIMQKYIHDIVHSFLLRSTLIRFSARETSYWTLVAGQNRRSAYSRFRQLRKPKKLFLHPQFDHTTINNDIALIQLATPLEFTHYLQPICLPRSGDEVDIGTRCYVAGWGKTDTFG